ncbi:MAG: hypothetical protein KKC73_04540 [Proteobacteria bacterium]|nr:hypothetical protein [Pseudomonadota bacterium]
MRFDKFTIKSQELIQNAHTLASQYNNQQIEPEHLISAMLAEEEGIAKAMLSKLGVSPDGVAQDMALAVDKLPKISGSGIGDVHISQTTSDVLEAAFVEAAKMKDQYVSIEHIFLAISDKKDCKATEILGGYGIKKEALLKVLMDIRGSQRITDPNPEEKYQALDRFSRDLTNLARFSPNGRRTIIIRMHIS